MIDHRSDTNEIEPEVNQQYIYKEILCDPYDLDCMDMIEHDNTERVIEEALIVARQLLYKRILDIALKFMTPHQQKVFVLMLKKKTYNEIATIMQDNYSCAYSGYTAVSHAIKGQLNKERGTYHGGLEKKLRKTCNKDKYCLEILDWISKMTDDPDVAHEFLCKYDLAFTDDVKINLEL